jgi:large subunit ribosomal protein L21
MYAIVDIAGQQFKVEKDQKIFVHRLESEVGSQVDFDKVLLIDTDSAVVVGTPVIDGAMITAKVLEHLKGDKVIVFKKKRRKGYKVKNGHRQFFTKIEIENIFESGAKPKAARKPAAEKVAVTETPAEEKQEKAVKATVAKKPAAEKKEAPKKETAKKETAKKEAAPKKPAASKKAEGEAAPKKAKKAGDSK